MLLREWFLPSTVSIPVSIRMHFIKILIDFGLELRMQPWSLGRRDWEQRLSKMNQKFELLSWSLREFIIEGKTLVFHSESLPVLQCLAQAWPPWDPCKIPSLSITTLNALFSNLISNVNTEHVFWKWGTAWAEKSQLQHSAYIYRTRWELVVKFIFCMLGIHKLMSISWSHVHFRADVHLNLPVLWSSIQVQIMLQRWLTGSEKVMWYLLTACLMPFLLTNAMQLCALNAVVGHLLPC